MPAPRHSRLLACCALLAACGAAAPSPDYAEYLAVGVDPRAEADAVEAGLASDGYTRSTRVDGEGWSALAMTRADGASVARVVTVRGVVVAVDESVGALGAARGVLTVEPAPPSGTDVDGDGTLDVVLVRVEAERRCMLVVHLGPDGEVAPLSMDAADVPADACLEAFEDVDGNGSPEALVGIRASRLARTATPTVLLPIERDEASVYRRIDPPERWIADQRRARAVRLADARTIPDAEAAYTVAVELALVSHVVGETTDLQLVAFDEAISGVVLTAELLAAVHATRAAIAAGEAFP